MKHCLWSNVYQTHTLMLACWNHKRSRVHAHAHSHSSSCLAWSVQHSTQVGCYLQGHQGQGCWVCRGPSSMGDQSHSRKLPSQWKDEEKTHVHTMKSKVHSWLLVTGYSWHVAHSMHNAHTDITLYSTLASIVKACESYSLVSSPCLSSPVEYVCVGWIAIHQPRPLQLKGIAQYRKCVFQSTIWVGSHLSTIEVFLSLLLLLSMSSADKLGPQVYSAIHKSDSHNHAIAINSWKR